MEDKKSAVWPELKVTSAGEICTKVDYPTSIKTGTVIYTVTQTPYCDVITIQTNKTYLLILIENKDNVGGRNLLRQS